MSPLLLAAVVLVASANGLPPPAPKLSITMPESRNVTWQVGDSDRKFKYCMTPGIVGYRLVLTKKGFQDTVFADNTPSTAGSSHCMTMKFPQLTSTYFAGRYTVELIGPDDALVKKKAILVNIDTPPTAAGPVTTITPPPVPTLSVNVPPPVAGAGNITVNYCMAPARPGFFLSLSKNGAELWSHEASGVFSSYCVDATLHVPSGDSWNVRLLEGANVIAQKNFTLPAV